MSKYITSVDSQLRLCPPSNVINEEKKEMLRNLLESEIPEEMVTEQLATNREKKGISQHCAFSLEAL
ncbi:MAG: hypothetical protein M3P08_04205 [Thermoproteota archaeon]|nr:hypothetical protein [Thermoproteota archaeon]